TAIDPVPIKADGAPCSMLKPRMAPTRKQVTVAHRACSCSRNALRVFITAPSQHNVYKILLPGVDRFLIQLMVSVAQQRGCATYFITNCGWRWCHPLLLAIQMDR